MDGPADPSTEGDEARWAAAVARLVSGPTPADLQHARRVRRLVWLGAVVLLLVAVGTGLLLGLRGGDGAEADVEVAPWRQVTGLVLSGAGLLVMVVGSVLAWRAGVWRGLPTSPLRSLTRQQQRGLLRQVQGRAPADPAHLPLARHLAGQLQRQVRLLPFWSGMVLTQSGQLVAASRVRDRFLPAVLTLLFVVLCALMVRQTRQATRFLARHPAAEPAGAAD